MKTLGILFIFCVLAVNSPAATWEVRQDGLGDFINIRDAVDVAASGDQILVWPGTYFEPVLTLYHDILLSSLDGQETTILDGEGTNRCLHVTAGASVQIIGFSIQNCFAYDGAGIHVDQGANATVVNCSFSNNEASYTGGAGFVREPSSVLTFESCSFVDNYAPLNAGAVGVSIQSTCNFYDCEFFRNRSVHMAGAIANYDNSTMTIESCLFVDNSGGECGAIRIYDSPAVIRNNTFFGNTSGIGSIYLHTSHSVALLNNIVTMDVTGFGVFSLFTPYSSCNIFYGNQAGSVSGFPLPPTDVEVDPLFCNMENNQFGLCEDSPALPANNDCGLIGGVETVCDPCGPVNVEDRSWGAVKSLFR